MENIIITEENKEKYLRGGMPTVFANEILNDNIKRLYRLERIVNELLQKINKEE